MIEKTGFGKIMTKEAILRVVSQPGIMGGRGHCVFSILCTLLIFLYVASRLGIIFEKVIKIIRLMLPYTFK